MKWFKNMFRKPPEKVRVPRLIGSPQMDPKEEYIIMAAIVILTRDYEKYAAPWEILCRHFDIVRVDGTTAAFRLSLEKVE